MCLHSIYEHPPKRVARIFLPQLHGIILGKRGCGCVLGMGSGRLFIGNLGFLEALRPCMEAEAYGQHGKVPS